MAQKVSVTLVDDLDESVADETVLFALDGATYEIDLNDANAAEMRDILAPFVAAARRAGRDDRSDTASRPPRKRAARAAGSSTADAVEGASHSQQVREWARANGHAVSERGRLSAAVLEAYQAAHH